MDTGASRERTGSTEKRSVWANWNLKFVYFLLKPGDKLDIWFSISELITGVGKQTTTKTQST